MPQIKKWSNEELENLKNLYTSENNFEEILNAIPKRSVNAIRIKASRMGLRRPLPTIELHSIKSLIVTSDRKQGSQGYIFRCNECNKWIQVENEKIENNKPIVCKNCGAVCYFT
jgi:DNA-directed RNA polymerase subunit RPC12/RpoP